MTEKRLCRSKISPNWQTTVQREARAMLELKPGDEIDWILKDGEVVVRRVMNPQMKIDHENVCFREDCHFNENDKCLRSREECNRCFRTGRLLFKRKAQNGKGTQ